MKYNLIVAEPGKEPVPYELNADRIGLGRGPENQIEVPSEFVSHTHLEFHHVDDGIAIEDLGSKNGTRVNGQTFDGKRTLRDGDRILIGECVAAHLLLLPDDADPVEAAPKGDEAKHKAAAAYTTLDRKLQDLETDIESKQSEADELTGKINALSKQIEAKKTEFAELEGSVEKLRNQLESKREAAGENATPEVASEIAAIEKDLLKQTQKITVLKTDLDKREAEISELQLTAKVQVASPVPAAKTVAPATPAAAVKAAPAAAPAIKAATPAAAQAATPPAPAPSPVTITQPGTPASPPAPPVVPAAPPAANTGGAPAVAAIPAVPAVKPVASGAATPTPLPVVAAVAKPVAPPAAGKPAAPTVKLNTPKAAAPKKPVPIPKRPD